MDVYLIDGTYELFRHFLFRTLATLRCDVPLFDSVDILHWNGPTTAFAPLAARFEAAVTAADSASPRRSGAWRRTEPNTES